MRAFLQFRKVFLQVLIHHHHQSHLLLYLQRAVGYSLIGDTRAQVLFFLYGLGNNGKSTFIATIRKVMAGYGATAPVDMFLAKDKPARGPRKTWPIYRADALSKR